MPDDVVTSGSIVRPGGYITLQPQEDIDSILIEFILIYGLIYHKHKKI